MILTPEYATLGIFVSFMIIAMIVAIILWKLIAAGGPLEIFGRRSIVPEPYKRVAYECGEIPIGKTRFTFDIEYYVFPLIFIVFDVFTPFLYLWAVGFNINDVLGNLFFLALISLLVFGMFLAITKDGKALLTPYYYTKEFLEFIDKAAEGDEEALNEFLRIEPLTIIKKEAEIKPASKDILRKITPISMSNGNVNPILGGLRRILRKLLGWLFKWGLSKSPWITFLGIKCCALEIPMAVGVSRFDMERWGVIPPASPRQDDLMIVNGPVTIKWAQRLKTIYDQMAEPKFVVAIGECAIVGGPFKDSYTVISGVNKIIPVDFYIPGCPPRPEAFLEFIMTYRRVVPDKVKEYRRRSIEARNEVIKALEKILKE